jgi:hypothetical protein
MVSCIHYNLVFCAGSSNKGVKPKIFIALSDTSFAWMNIVKKFSDEVEDISLCYVS